MNFELENPALWLRMAAFVCVVSSLHSALVLGAASYLNATILGLLGASHLAVVASVNDLGITLLVSGFCSALFLLYGLTFFSEGARASDALLFFSMGIWSGPWGGFELLILLAASGAVVAVGMVTFEAMSAARGMARRGSGPDARLLMLLAFWLANPEVLMFASQ